MSLLLVCFLLLFFVKPLQSATICDPNDQKVLLQIKNHFKNASAFSTWDPKIDCCNWVNNNVAYVGCEDHANPGRVTSLTVRVGPCEDQNKGSSEVVGNIPPEVGNLPFLKSLTLLYLPNLTGPIPQTITKLTKLKVLELNTNKLTGPVPDFLSKIKSLHHISLFQNNFTGSIPSSLSQLPHLVELNLFRNSLTGTIPKSFGSFRTGLDLQVSQNKLSGTIPRSLGHANITMLDLSENNFTGDVSFLFGRNKTIYIMDLRYNKFKFDFTHVDLPQSLRVFYIAYNKIYGSLPKRLGQLPLLSIDVSHNQLCGKIPTGRRLKRFPLFRFAHNKCLCGAPLSPLQEKNVIRT